MAGDGDLRRSTATSGGTRRQAATDRGKTVSQSDPTATSCGSGSAAASQLQPPLWSYVNIIGKPPREPGSAIYWCFFVVISPFVFSAPPPRDPCRHLEIRVHCRLGIHAASGFMPPRNPYRLGVRAVA
ncbi:hypothetical protein EJ110_NYTH51393 [Nymphaea thermarum]|nr:hypothetical protein EJ110_NYTH51393 [Nymphaea thermarum]